MTKILITGASGFLGQKLFTTFSKKFEVIGTGFSKTHTFEKLDITKPGQVNHFFEQNKFDLVIHAAALTNVDWCEQNKEETFLVNVSGTENIAKACKKHNSKLFLISTDFVYPGNKQEKYDENSETKAVNVYGQSKLEAEKTVLQLEIESLISRVTVLYGFNSANDKLTFPTWVLKTLRENKDVKVINDQFSNPTLIDDIANALLSLHERRSAGVYNMTGSNCISKFEFARQIAKTFDLDDKRIIPCNFNETRQAAERPKYVDCSTSKLESEGIRMSSTIGGLQKMKTQMDEHI